MNCSTITLRSPLRWVLLACLAGWISGPQVRACSTPVFLYALERWQPDPYLVFILHREPLNPLQQQAAQLLHSAAIDHEAPANLVVQMVDLSQPADGALRTLLEELGDPPELPWMLVGYPTAMMTDRHVYSGPMNETAVRSAIDSSARRETVDRIVAGDTAVWVFISSGDASKDDSARSLLQQELGRLEKTLKPSEPPQDAELADPAGGPVADLRTVGPLKFSILQVARDDPAESFFVSMLVHSEVGLDEHPGPFAIPVFGRGRSYYALAGAGINAENIERSCSFLVGACSCEVKSQNPGADLLLRANWDQLLGDLELDVDFLPELTALGPIRDAVAAVETAPPPTHLPAPVEGATDAVGSTELPVVLDQPIAPPLESRLPAYLPALGAVLGGLLIVVIGTLVIKAQHASTE